MTNDRERERMTATFLSIKNRRTFFILKATRKRPSEDGLRRVLYSLKSVSSALKANSTILNNSTHTKKKERDH